MKNRLLDVAFADSPEGHFTPSLPSTRYPLWKIFSYFALFLIATLGGGFRLPSRIHQSSRYFPLNSTHYNSSVEIGLGFTRLTTDERFININCSIVTAFSTPSSLNISTLSSYYTRHTFLRENRSSPSPHVIPDFQTDSFTIVHDFITDFDRLDVSVILAGHLDELDGFFLTWALGDSCPEAYLIVVKAVMSLFIIVILANFSPSLRASQRSFRQVISIVLACLGFLAANPV
jgi:hypothetical protein